VDSNALAGRLGDFVDGHWTGLTYLPCVAENGFVPELPSKRVDLVYLCYPNNPTGATLTRAQLTVWVDWALANGAVILYDAAYRAYVSREEVPRSIYEIPGAQGCAVEINSFSKTAGFTGLRCGWTVVPKALTVDGVALHGLWARRQATKFNGAPYIVQRAAEAVYSEEGRRQAGAAVAYYMENARWIREALLGAGISVSGGVDAPYVWMKCPGGMDSWAFFDTLLREARVIGTPGSGFGPSGAGYFRLTAFASAADTREAMERVAAVL
jgi:LL-diaminopimelate aminotransferase